MHIRLTLLTQILIFWGKKGTADCVVGLVRIFGVPCEHHGVLRDAGNEFGVLRRVRAGHRDGRDAVRRLHLMLVAFAGR